jgi:hypothetical protein
MFIPNGTIWAFESGPAAAEPPSARVKKDARTTARALRGPADIEDDLSLMNRRGRA